MSEPIDPRIANARPAWALVILAAPIVAFVVVGVLYAGMWSIGMSGRGLGGAQGSFEVDACEEALPLISARLDDMGLPHDWAEAEGRRVLEVALTGRDSVDQALPATLSAPGRFALRHGDEALFDNAGVTEATYRLDGMMDIWLLLRLHDAAAGRVRRAVRADPRGRLTFELDGAAIAMQPNGRAVSMGEVEGMPLDDMTAEERSHRVAAWSVIIDHGPYPCPVAVRARLGRAGEPEPNGQ